MTVNLLLGFRLLQCQHSLKLLQIWILLLLLVILSDGTCVSRNRVTNTADFDEIPTLRTRSFTIELGTRNTND